MKVILLLMFNVSLSEILFFFFFFFFPSGIPEYCWMIPMEVLSLKRRL